MSKKVAVIMGSDSDLPVVKGALDELDKFGIPYEVHVMSGTPTPALVMNLPETRKRLRRDFVRRRKGQDIWAAFWRKTYHAAGDRHSGQVFYTGRAGRIAGNRTDAEGHSGGNCRNRRGSQCRNSGSTDAGTV